LCMANIDFACPKCQKVYKTERKTHSSRSVDGM
jgi:hypothetical protein